MFLCRYSDLLGKPREGVHSIRLFDIAIVDVALTLVGAYLLSYLTAVDYWVVLLFLTLSGIFLHWLFCINTTVNVALFGLTGEPEREVNP